MTLDLYTTTSERHRLDKVLSNKITKNCSVKAGTDLLNPTVTIGYDVSVLSKSYAYIADFGRYYYITGVEVTPGQQIVLHLHVDVLKTYSSQIKACSARITRSQSNPDPMIADNLIINKVNTNITQRKLGAGFTRSNKYYVLIGG